MKEGLEIFQQTKKEKTRLKNHFNGRLNKKTDYTFHQNISSNHPWFAGGRPPQRGTSYALSQHWRYAELGASPRREHKKTSRLFNQNLSKVETCEGLVLFWWTFEGFPKKLLDSHISSQILGCFFCTLLDVQLHIQFVLPWVCICVFSFCKDLLQCKSVFHSLSAHVLMRFVLEHLQCVFFLLKPKKPHKTPHHITRLHLFQWSCHES